MQIFAPIAVKGILRPILAGLLLAIEDGFVGSADTLWK